MVLKYKVHRGVLFHFDCFLMSLLLASFLLNLLTLFMAVLAFRGRLYRLLAIKCCKFDPVSTLADYLSAVLTRVCSFCVCVCLETRVSWVRKSFIVTSAYVIHTGR